MQNTETIRIPLDTENFSVTVDVSLKSMEPNKISLECEEGTLRIVPNWTGFHAFLVSNGETLPVKMGEGMFELLDTLFFGQKLEGVSEFLYGYWSASYVVWHEYMTEPERFFEAFVEG